MVCSLADLALVVGRSLRVREIDAPEVLQAAADMEKRSSDSFHYYHFLRSVAQPEGAAPSADMGQSPTAGQSQVFLRSVADADREGADAGASGVVAPSVPPPATADEIFKQIAG